MSTFNISDITPAGAYMAAMTAAQVSDRRNADRYAGTGEGRNILKSLRALVQRISIIIAEKLKSARLVPN